MNEFVSLLVRKLRNEEFILNFGIANIPIDAIIIWKDICSHGLFDVLLGCKMVNDQEVKVIEEVPKVSVPIISEGNENGPVDTNTSSESANLVQIQEESSENEVEKDFKLDEVILTIKKKQLKSNLLWKSPCIVRKKLDAEMFEVEDVKTKEVFIWHRLSYLYQGRKSVIRGSSRV